MFGWPPLRLWLTPRRKSGMDLRPRDLSSQRLCSLPWSSVYTFLILFFGLTPRSSCRSTADTRAHSACKHSISFHTVGWLWPTRFLNLLFQPYILLIPKTVDQSPEQCNSEQVSIRKILLIYLLNCRSITWAVQFWAGINQKGSLDLLAKL